MTEPEKMRAGFAQLVQAVDALKSIVDRADLDPINLEGPDPLDGYTRQIRLDGVAGRAVFDAVLNTLREVCDQGAKMGLPAIEEVRRSPIIIPSQELRP